MPIQLNRFIFYTAKVNQILVKESFILRKSLENLMEKGSREAKNRAKSLLDVYKASILSTCKIAISLPTVPITRGHSTCCSLYDALIS